MDTKLIGGILLIVGTSIGAGMLALPIATAQLGFVGSVVLLLGCWFVMIASALLILEVNLWLPQNSNLISMAKVTIGPIGQVIAWITYLLLLYSLLSAYVAGGSDLLHALFLSAGITFPLWISAILFVLIFGSVVYFGIRSVDYVNRLLMFLKFAAYFLLVAMLAPHVVAAQLAANHFAKLTSVAAITVTITSFGYATIVPSLRIYFAGDVKKLKWSILIGSLIPLVFYIIWDAAIMGVVPLAGEHGLIAIMQSNHTTSDLVSTLNAIVTNQVVIYCLKLFTSICVLTSFLGVALCLTDFLADGLHLSKVGESKFFIHLLVMMPPLLIALFFPNVFIKALEYAGIYCIVLLTLLPAWMAWCGRYRLGIASGYQVVGGKWLLIFLVLFSLGMIISGLLS